MLRTHIIGMISEDSTDSLCLKSPRFSQDHLSDFHYSYIDRNNTRFFTIVVHHADPAIVSIIDDINCIVICVGYSFHHSNLATVVAKQYNNKGIHYLKETRGYYNAIILDKITGIYYISTDAVGICPIYYVKKKDKLIFSNTMKGLILSQTERPQFNYKVLFELFHLGMVTPPDTLIKDIHSLPADYYLTYRDKIESQSFQYPTMTYPSFDEDQLYEMLLDTMRPIANYDSLNIICSGGLDSSIIVAILRQLTENPIHLSTLHEGTQYADATNPSLLAQDYKASLDYHKTDITNFMPAIFKSLWLLESEAVGSLSFNLALEWELAHHMTTLEHSLISTGDVFSVKMETTPNIKTYVERYHLTKQPKLMQLLRMNTDYGYFHFLKKYMGFGSEQHLFFPEVLVMRLSGKLRLNMSAHQKYYLPFVDGHYLRYIQNLCQQFPSFQYRLSLAKLAKHRQLLPKQILLSPKRWMPSWIKHHHQNPCPQFLKILMDTNSFCRSLFNLENMSLIANEYYQCSNSRLILALFYLELFYRYFIADTQHLASAINFSEQNTTLIK